ncbi:MAG: hypothetical protein ACYS8Z_23700 [Planctomycetota bacterium]|jgi:hypothetical protein
MPNIPANFNNRRSFFIGAMRYAALGVLAAAVGLMAAKRYRLKRQGVCINDGLCTRCKALQSCRLPLALAAKKVSKD